PRPGAKAQQQPHKAAPQHRQGEPKGRSDRPLRPAPIPGTPLRVAPDPKAQSRQAKSQTPLCPSHAALEARPNSLISQRSSQYEPSFLPDARRTLRPDGIWLHGIPYWSNTLSGRVGRTKGELLIKFDPRDVLFAIHLTLTDSLSIRIRCRNGAQAERFSRIRELICAIMIGPIENSPTVAFRVSSRR